MFMGKWQSSKHWAEDTLAQAALDVEYGVRNYAGLSFSSLFGGTTDFSWERSIYEYTWGNQKRGLEGLGHILHLIQDATVPDHTRNDPHPPYFDEQWDEASPYEKWTNQFTVDNLKISESLILEKTRFPKYTILRDAFDETAIYSNKYFLSKDTTDNKIYPQPPIHGIRKIQRNNRAEVFALARDSDGEEYLLGRVESENSGKWKLSLQRTDIEVLRDYWDRLSKTAVINGAGVVKLFFDEVEKERKTKVLYEKNRAWLTKKIDRSKDYLYSLVAGLYGASVKTRNIEDAEAAEKAEALARSAAIEAARKAMPPPPAPKLAKEIKPEINPAKPVEAEAVIEPAKPAAEAPKEEKIPSPNDIGRFVGGGGPPPASSSSSSSSSGSSSPAPAPATPNISLSVDGCSTTIASSGCLLTGTSTTIRWSSTAADLDRYVVTCTTGGAACTGFGPASTSTSIAFSLSDNSSYTFTAKAVSTSSLESTLATQEITVSTRPIVINEVAWAGTSATRAADEWVELYNRTGLPINLSGFVLYSAGDLTPYIALSGSIAANGFYLLERTDNAPTSVAADLIYTGALENGGEVLTLAYASTTIDATPALGACINPWCGGDNTNYAAMERYDPDASGTAASNWASNNLVIKNGTNADGAALAGTPRARNSLNYRPILSSSTAFASSATLTAARSPYYIDATYTVNNGVTLTIEQGVVIKLSGGTLAVDGTLNAVGGSATSSKIVFTSFHDDTYGGDLNGTTTAAVAGDWRRITLSGAGSTLTNVIIRYGGNFTNPGDATENRAELFVNGSSPTLSNLIVEFSKNIGVSFFNSSGTLSNSAIQQHSGTGTQPMGIYITGTGTPTLSGNTIQNNLMGISVIGASATISSNSFLSNTNEAINATNNGVLASFSSNTATGNGTNGIVISGNLSTSGSLSANLPYTSSAGFTVNNGVALTIPAGTVLKSNSATPILSISGQVLVQGTAASPVTFTSLSDDATGGDTNNNGTTTLPAAGDWSRITIVGSSATSTIQYATFAYGGRGSFGEILVQAGHADIQNSTMASSSTVGLLVNGGGVATASNSTVRNNATGAKVDEANSTLTISNTVFQDNTIPLVQSGGGLFINGGGNSLTGTNGATVPAGLLP